MDHTWFLILGSGLSMCMRDVINTACTFFISRTKPWPASILDGTADMFQYASLGGPLLVFKEHGISTVTALAFVSVFIGSVIGTQFGLRTASRFCLPVGK